MRPIDGSPSLAVVAAKKYFLPYRNALVEAFLKLGAQAKAVERLEDAAPADGALVVGMHYHQNASARAPERMVLGAIHTEQLPTAEAGSLAFGKDRMRVFLRDYRHYDCIFDWSPVNAAALGKRYPRLYHLHHGTLLEAGADSQHRNPNPEYDVLFIGAADGVAGRRAAILDAVKRRFKVFPEHSGLWGAKKVRAMANAAIILNVHYDVSAAFEAPRVWEALTMGCFLLSEPMARSEPFAEGRDYAAAFAHQMPDAIARYLEDAETRKRIAARGRATALEYPMVATAARILRQFQLEAAYLQNPANLRRRRWRRRLGWERLLVPGRL